MPERRLFLGRIRPDDLARVGDSPLVRPWDGHPSATWPYGSGGAPHAGVWGTTGGGKSSLLRLLLRGLVRRPGPRAITIIDAEGAGEFTVFDGMPGIAGIINANPAADAKLPDGTPTSVDRAAGALADTLALANERNEEREAAQRAWLRLLKDPAHHRAPDYQAPGEVWLVIDGFASFRYALRRYSKVAGDVTDDLVLTGRLGRKVDVHLVLADQVTYAARTKDDDGMPSPLRKQLGCRIGAVGELGMTATESQQAFDDPDAAKRIPPTPGGCLVQIGASRMPFVVPRWLNATDPDLDVPVGDRRAAYRLLPEAVA